MIFIPLAGKLKLFLKLRNSHFIFMICILSNESDEIPNFEVTPKS